MDGIFAGLIRDNAETILITDALMSERRRRRPGHGAG